MTIKRQIKEKKKLEEKIKPKLKKFFKQMNADAKVIWKATGQLPDFSFYEEDLTGILREHYRITGKKFSTSMMSGLKRKSSIENLEIKQEGDEEEISNVEDEESAIEEAVLIALLVYIASHSKEQARIIIKTTEKDYNKIIDRAVSDAAAKGVNLSRDEVAELIASKFSEIIDGKVSVISQTETQDMAEQSKLIEAIVISASAILIGGVLIGARMHKIWNSVFLPTTRAHHAAADNQRVKLDQPFTVKGQQLMRPSDTSLGATPDNIINCYCFVTFEI